MQARLAANPEALATLEAMEDSGGEPDVIASGSTGAPFRINMPTGRLWPKLSQTSPWASKRALAPKLLPFAEPVWVRLAELKRAGRRIQQHLKVVARARGDLVAEVHAMSLGERLVVFLADAHRQ